MANWTPLRSQDENYGYAVLEDAIQKPDLDNRDYRSIELDNGLRALLVHDAGAEKAAACLTVQVGAMFDPVSLVSSLPASDLTVGLAARRAGDCPLLRAPTTEGDGPVPRRERLLCSKPGATQTSKC